MKGDFSRLTFDVTNHFSRVLMQQGRVQLDADWNEQTAILLHYLQTLAKDLIGAHGGPKDNEGFEIKQIEKELDFQIGHGRYYVDGILVENESLSFPITVEGNNGNKKLKLPSLTIKDVKLKVGQYLELSNSLNFESPQIVRIQAINSEGAVLTFESNINNSPNIARRVITYQTQDDIPLPDTKELEKDNVYLVYLDLWERHISYVEDDSIREVALGGPDTAARAKLLWQVKTESKRPTNTNGTDIPIDKNKILKLWNYFVNQWQPANRGLLKALAKQDRKKDDTPCVTSPESSYRGAENQLYRVEIHKGGIAWTGNNDDNSIESAATFKWSRDNGSVVTGVKLNGTELTFDNPRGLYVGGWLELTNDNQELRGEPGVMAKIKAIECDTVTLEFTGTVKPPKGEVWPTKARLWESDQITITESGGNPDKNSDKNWHKLENGVQIQFQFQASIPANQYRTGDYWLIPTRVATGDVEWPGEVGKPEPLPPHGIEHHYAPLAVITIENNNNNATITVTDLREKFEPLSKDLST